MRIPSVRIEILAMVFILNAVDHFRDLHFTF